MKQSALRSRAQLHRTRLETHDSTAPHLPGKQEKPSLLIIFSIWALIVFTIVPEGFNYAVPDPGASVIDAPAAGNPVNRLIWLACLALGIVFSFSRSGAAIKLLRSVNPFLLLFIGLAGASVLWSIEPGVTLRRLLRVVTILLDAVALGVAASDPKVFQNTIRPVLTALLVGSIIFVLLDPKEAIELSTASELKDAWHGLTQHKNEFGSLSAITFVFWWHAFLSKERPAALSLIGVALSGICLLNSRSSTSIMATAFAVFLLLLLLRSPSSMKRYVPYMIGAFLTALLIYSLAVLNLVPGSNLLLSPVAMITGKDQTFSGRTPIWNILNQHIALSPLYGSGYGGYWNLLPSSPSMEMVRELYFYPNEGHNGYLDVINDLGLLGAVCLVGYIVTFLRQGLLIFKTMRPQGALYLALLFEQSIGNLSESRWLNTLIFDFVIMTTATVIMGKTLMQQRARALDISRNDISQRVAAPKRL